VINVSVEDAIVMIGIGIDDGSSHVGIRPVGPEFGVVIVGSQVGALSPEQISRTTQLLKLYHSDPMPTTTRAALRL
jgi:hypothetical protein